MKEFELHFLCFPEQDSTFRNVKPPKRISNLYLKCVQICKYCTDVGKVAGCKYLRRCLFLWNLGMDLPHVSVLTPKFLRLLQDFMNMHDTQQ